jgi:hypothetical protein
MIHDMRGIGAVALVGFVVGDVIGSLLAVGPERAVNEFTALGIGVGLVSAAVSAALWVAFSSRAPS